jgi:hypothetical protein
VIRSTVSAPLVDFYHFYILLQLHYPAGFDADLPYIFEALDLTYLSYIPTMQKMIDSFCLLVDIL